MSELLALSAHLPELQVDAGHVLIADGSQTGRCYVLVEGAVEVRQHGVLVAATREPGACFGESAALLGTRHMAEVIAVEPTTLRVADDAVEFLGHPGVSMEIARLLAKRLRLATSYLADLQQQYADHGGNLGLVGHVLGSLLEHGQRPPVQPGSAREPNPPY